MKHYYLTKTIVAIVILIIVIALLNNLDLSPKMVMYNLFSPYNNPFYFLKETGFAKIETNIPKINSAIATYPFASSLVENTIDKKNYNNELQYVSTFQAYQDIIDNIVDFSIASETNQAQRTIIDNIPDIKLVPIAKEALAFYINRSNSIQSLSIKDLNNIYGEKVKNWAELGGKDIKISPYQLEKDVGGSEQCFSQIVTNNTSFSNEDYIAYDMKNIIDLTAEEPGGIGYSFNMFCSKLYNVKSVRKISIEGTYPSYENITSGKYPLMFNIYFIYRESNDNPNIKTILDWLLLEEGQKLVAKNGYQPIR